MKSLLIYTPAVSVFIEEIMKEANHRRAEKQGRQWICATTPPEAELYGGWHGFFRLFLSCSSTFLAPASARS